MMNRFRKTASVLSVVAMLSPVLGGCIASANGNTHHVNRPRVSRVTRATNKMVKFGEKLDGTKYSQMYHDRGAKRIARGVKSHKADETDTTGFTWGLLKHDGFRVSKSPWIVGPGGSENRFFKARHETVPANKTRKGTVVMANKYAHNAILLQKWHGKDTKVLEEGGSHNDVNVSTYGEAFGHGNRPSEFANPALK